MEIVANFGDSSMVVEPVIAIGVNETIKQIVLDEES